MGPQPEPVSRIGFGPFEFDAVSGDLRKGGSRIRLQGQPLQILCTLIQRPGQVISRDELQRQLWGNATFVDFEQGLNAAVNKLRQALSDSADQPRYIETVPGRGYRFIAPIQRAAGRPVIEMAPPSRPAAELRLKRSKRWLPWTAAAVMAVVAVGAYWLGTRNTRPVEDLRTARFTVAAPAGFALEGGASRQSFALSPDGRHLAFTAVDSGGAASLFVRDLNGLEPKPIPETRGVHTMFWAPDSRSLFATVRGKLKRMTLEGESQVVLGEAPSFLFSGVWLSPSKLILSTNKGSFAGAPSGGSPEPLKAAYPWPQILPDGEHILFVAWDPQIKRYRARAGRLADGAESKPLLEADSRAQYTASSTKPGTGYLLYVRAGSLLASPFDPRSLSVTGDPIPVASEVYYFFPTGAADFSVSDKGAIAYLSNVSRSQLIWVDRQGKQVAAASPADINVKSGRLSPNGRQVAAAIYDAERGAQSLWLFDNDTGAGRTLTLDSGVRDAPVWSPDSRQLAYLYGSGGNWPRVGIRGLGESDEEKIVPSVSFQMPTDWSPDGRFIVFSDTAFTRFASEAQGDVFAIDLARDKRVTPLLNTKFHEGSAAFSPDGKWLSFISNESGQPEMYLQAFEGGESPNVTGERFPASRSGALAVRWRRDGKEIFYLGFDGQVYAVPVTLSAKPKFGPAKPLFQISGEARAAIHSLVGFDVSGDGQRFLIPVVNRSIEAPSLVVVQNWEAGISKQ